MSESVAPPLTEDEARWRRGLVLGAAAATVVAAGLVLIRVPAGHRDLFALRRHQIPRVLFTNASALAALGHPVRVEGSPATNWRALHWTIEDLLQRSREPKLFWGSRQSRFHYFDKGQFMTEALTARGVWHPTHREVNLTLARFVEQCDITPVEEHLYYTGQAEDANGHVVDDVRPIEPLLPWDSGPGYRVNTWLGCAGVSMNAHYDLSHNVFVHILGQKTFFLLPPTASSSLYVHGKGHPQFRTSRIPDLAHVPLREFPLFEAIGELWVADLEPGDVLYVPPTWIHLVVAGSLERGPSVSLGPSVSVNVFSDSVERAAYEAVEALPVPFEAEWPRATMLAAVPALMHLICRLVRTTTAFDGSDGDHPVSGSAAGMHLLVQQWAASRWAHLTHETDAIMADCRIDEPLFATEHFQMRATALADGFLRIPGDGPRRLLMQNYWDTLVAFTMEWDPFLAARYAVDIARFCFPPSPSG